MRNWLVGLLAVVILTACTDDERYYLDDRNDYSIESGRQGMEECG